MKLTKKAAADIVGGLSNPGKMPCKGISLPASACITGSKLALIEGTVRSKCYAKKGMYTFPVVQNALSRRLQALDHPRWTEAMVTLLQGEEYFRWHDSGDIQNNAHMDKIWAVCRQTPSCNHWLPTKELGMVSDYVRENGIPHNLVVRASAPKLDSKAIKTPDGILSCRTMKVGTDVGTTSNALPTQETANVVIAETVGPMTSKMSSIRSTNPLGSFFSLCNVVKRERKKIP